MQIGELPIAAVFADRYLVERRLGQGGMATVYLGRDQKHGRQVAIKVLRPELAASLGPERFLREISIAAHLAHPHILPLHDSGAGTHETGGGGLLWYVMPYVDGESLRDLLTRERQLPIEDALRLSCEVADALDYAHRHNVVHRDIKPENILLEDGHAVVSDFGIARAIRSASEGQLTEAGLAIGTPAYMSPEQASGEGNLDGRSDLYSLGCVLYEMLAGEPPFTGQTPAVIVAKRLSSAPPGVRILRPAATPEVEQVLARALAQVPADRFRTAAELRAALAACAPATAERLPSGASRGQTAPAISPRAPPRWARAGAIVLAVLVVAAMLMSRVREHGPTAAPASPLRTLAILPITNVSGNMDLAFLADGLTDALITELMRVSGLRVISPSSVMRYAGATGGMSPSGMAAGATPSPMGSMGPPKSLAQIARELRADVVMQASLTRQADTIRVSAALVNPETQARFWTHGYVRPQRDLFRLQQELAAAVAGALRGSGGSASATAVATRRMVDPAANESYLKGLYYQAHWKLPEAIAAYEKAVAQDSGFAPAYSGMARAYYFMAFFGDMAPAVALGKMEYAAGMALEKDSLLAEAHGQMALVKMLHEWNWPAAERSFRRALELSPGDAQIRHDYAHFLLALGRRHESLAQTEQAVALDPANPMLISCMGWHSLFDKQYQRAIEYASDANQMMPQFWAKIVQAWALLGEGKPDSAVPALREATRLTDNAFAAAALANGLAVTGRTEEARRILRQLLARQEREYVSAYDIASVYAGLHEPDGAFKWLRRAADERSTFFVHLGWDARFEGLRKDARYRELIEQRLALPTPGAMVASAAVRNGSSKAE